MQETEKKPNLLLIDGNHLLNRNFHIPRFKDLGVVINGNMFHTGGAYGFVNSVKKIIDEKMDHCDEIVIAWDSGGENFRKDIDPQYKGNRKSQSKEFKNQYDLAKELMFSLGISQCWHIGEEADDLIGIMATKASNDGWRCQIISGDKDFYQLVNDSIYVIRPAQGDIPELIVTRDVVKEIFDVFPEQFVFLKSLMGDGSDNIGGIKGIGKKIGAEIVNAYSDFNEVLNADVIYKMKNGDRVRASDKIQSIILSNKDLLSNCYKLSKIKTEPDFDLNVRRSNIDLDLFREICEIYEFNDFLRNINHYSRIFQMT